MVANLQKICSRIMHTLISPNIVSMHRYNIFSLFLLDLVILNLLSSINNLVFKLGQNLSNILRFIFLKQKFPLILLLQSTNLSDLELFHYSYLNQRTELLDLTSFNQEFSLLPFLGHKASGSYLFSLDRTSFP
jgi:hypothetical protein